MKNLKDVFVSPTSSIREAIERIDAGSMQVALVVDDQLRLTGTVTDGDVRRGLLRGIPLEQQVSQIMNSTPVAAHQSMDREALLTLMASKDVRQIPILDDGGRVVDLVEAFGELKSEIVRENWVVLMAGGLGTRLRPLTEATPKPLLPVGGRPLLEDIVSRLVEHGFRRLFVSVNYKGEMIKAHFGGGERWGAEIKYLEEPTRLGTAGALTLLREKPTVPFLVINADVLTTVNYNQLIDFHQRIAARATMCVREYDLQVPYGVVTLDDHRIASIDEKPTQRFFINAGIYLLDPDVLDYLAPGEYMDMPVLFERLIANDIQTSAFPIREYWLDIGRLDDLERARNDRGERR